MTTSEVSAREYSAIFGPMFSHVYNSVAFAEFNSAKADAIRYLSIVDNKPRCGIIFGERQGRLISGFSAPFGGFDFVIFWAAGAGSESSERECKNSYTGRTETA